MELDFEAKIVELELKLDELTKASAAESNGSPKSDPEATKLRKELEAE